MPENYQDWLNLISGMDINGYKEFYYGPQYSDFVGAARKYSSANQIKKLTGIPGLSQLNVPGQTKLAPITFSKTGPDFLQRLKLAGSKINMDQVGGIASGVSGLAGIVGDSVNISRGQFTNDDLTNLNNDQQGDLFAFNQAAGNANTTSDLIHLTGLRPDFGEAVGNIETSKYNAGKTLGAMGKGALAGASLGSVIPGIGTAIGAIAGGIFGGISNAIGQGVGISGDNRRKSQAELEAERLGNMAYNSMLHAGTKVSTNTYRKGMANFLNNAAMGGPLSTHGSDFTDDLIRIDAGGSHEQNPFGGVPAGVDPQGIPNLVEEGETIWDDYVFSRRLKAPKSLVKRFGLGGSKDGMSYAEASKRISEKSGAMLRPNDPISKRTKEAQLAELEESQEEKRMKIEQRKLINALKSMSPDDIQGLMAQPAGMEAGMEPQLPPQGVVEEPMMAEPMQEEGMYEPTGFALGGHIFDGLNGESRRTISPLAGPQRLPGIGVIFDSNLGTLMPRDMTGTAYVTGNRITRHKTSTGRTYYMLNGERYQTLSGAQDALIEARRAIENNRAGKLDSAVTYGDSLGPIINKNNREGQKLVDSVLASTQRDPLQQVKRLREIESIRGNDNFRSPGKSPVGAYEKINPANYGNNAMRSAFMNFLNYDNYADLTSPGMYFVERGADVDDINDINENPTTSLSGLRGSGSGTRTSSQAGFTPNKIFSASSISPVDIYRRRSVMFNTPTPRSAVQKAIEGITATDPENTVSVGAMRNKPLPTWMRYAPIIGSGISVLGNVFSNPDYSDYDNLIAEAGRLGSPITIPVETIGARLRRNPFDERLAVNQANQNLLASRRGTTDNAGGNRAMRQFADNLLAYNNQGALSDIATKAYLANRQDALQTADFNRATDLYNMNAINQRNLTQAQLNSNRQQARFNALMGARQLYDSARRWDDQFIDADLTGFLQGLGDLGRENFIWNQIDSRNREGLSPVRYDGKSGNWIFDNRTVACGGKIKTKKRRF